MKIPPQAKKVFSGVIFDIYQWPQKMYDGSTQTFERLLRAPSTSVIAITGKNILLLEQEQPDRDGPYPSLPGGRIEENERPEVAAIRELSEETGYEASQLQLFALYNENSKIDFDDYVFVARDCKKIADQNLDAGEKIIVKLVNFDIFLQTARDQRFAIPQGLRYEMFEALLDKNKKAELQKKLGL